MSVRGKEWLTDDKGALASFLLSELPVAKKNSRASESSLTTRNISSDPDLEAAVSPSSVHNLPADLQTAPTRPDIQASQHCSSFPVTLDSTTVHQQHWSTTSPVLPVHCPPPPPPQPPSYVQFLAKSQFCHSESLSEPPAYTSSTVVTQPPRAAWPSVSAGSSSSSNGQQTQVLRRVQSFTSSMSSSGAVSSIPSATHIYSQKLSRPTSTYQGQLTIWKPFGKPKYLYQYED